MVRAVVPWPFKGMAARRMGRHVADVTDVVAAIDELRSAGASFVKVMVDSIPLAVPQLDDALLRAVVAGAHAAELPVLAHVGGNAEALRALAAGADVLVHNVYREPISTAVIEALKGRNVPVVATIGIWDAVDDVAQQGPPPLPFETLLTDADWRQEVRTRPEGWTLPGFEDWLDMIHVTRDLRLANAAALRAAGVNVLVGSDSPNVGWPAGSALHVELRKLVAAGFSPGEVLRAATAGNAGAFGMADRGLVAEGRRADLLLIDGDPTADLGALERLRLVLRGGVPVTFVGAE
jgi:imidazolonepropionase-like amidohydrolase